MKERTRRNSSTPSVTSMSSRSDEMSSRSVEMVDMGAEALADNSIQITAEAELMFAQAQKRARNDIDESLKNAAGPVTSPTDNPSRPQAIRIGMHEIKTAYYSPYHPYHAHVPVLYICQFCLSYMNSVSVLSHHMSKCEWRHPPGEEIYRNDNISVYEVNGKVARAYCQKLCLIAALFIDSKRLYYDVEPFLFYVVTCSDEEGCHFVGYFSKDKYCHDERNLCCIMILACYQRKGYGRFLIDFSYLLTRRENLTGSPERPFSDLGQISYASYWRTAIFEWFHKNGKTKFTLSDIASGTGISMPDVCEVLRALKWFQKVRTQPYLEVNWSMINEHWTQAKANKNRIWICESALKWTPVTYSSTNDSFRCVLPDVASKPSGAGAALRGVCPAGGRTIEEGFVPYDPNATEQRSRRSDSKTVNVEDGRKRCAKFNQKSQFSRGDDIDDDDDISSTHARRAPPKRRKGSGEETASNDATISSSSRRRFTIDLGKTVNGGRSFLSSSDDDLDDSCFTEKDSAKPIPDKGPHVEQEREPLPKNEDEGSGKSMASVRTRFRVPPPLLNVRHNMNVSGSPLSSSATTSAKGRDNSTAISNCSSRAQYLRPLRKIFPHQRMISMGGVPKNEDEITHRHSMCEDDVAPPQFHAEPMAISVYESPPEPSKWAADGKWSSVLPPRLSPAFSPAAQEGPDQLKMNPRALVMRQTLDNDELALAHCSDMEHQESGSDAILYNHLLTPLHPFPGSISVMNFGSNPLYNQIMLEKRAQFKSPQMQGEMQPSMCSSHVNMAPGSFGQEFAHQNNDTSPIRNNCHPHEAHVISFAGPLGQVQVVHASTQREKTTAASRSSNSIKKNRPMHMHQQQTSFVNNRRPTGGATATAQQHQPAHPRSVPRTSQARPFRPFPSAMCSLESTRHLSRFYKE